VPDLRAPARAALGIGGPLVLLRASDGGAVYRSPAGIVRVARSGTALVALAYDLAAAGAPIAAPIAGPAEHDGWVVSLWQDAPDDGRRDAAAMGRALAAFHAAGGPFRDRVPPWDPLAWLDARGVGGAVRERAAHAVGALRDGPPVLLHTDAHAGNFRVADGRALLVDLEQLATGPALYDLAALEVTERRFRGDRAIFRTFATAFGADPDDPRLPPLIALREVLAVGFVTAIGRPDVAAERLAQLDEPDARWTPF
jgi:phosphotransferase family enzyme